jgi:hypothetical protein
MNEFRWGSKLTLYLVTTTILLFLALLTSFTKYIYAKDYYFFVETPCNPESEICFVRDCNDYCPPNNFSTYKTFSIKAQHFSQCSDNTCQSVCFNKQTKNLCQEIVCNHEAGDECSS